MEQFQTFNEILINSLFPPTAGTNGSENRSSATVSAGTAGENGGNFSADSGANTGGTVPQWQATPGADGANTKEYTTVLPEQPFSAENAPYSEEGYLIVQVSTARSSVPLGGAEVTITTVGENGEVSLVKTTETDSSGKTEKIPLPAPPHDLSEHPSIQGPFAVYNIRVEYPQYYPTEFRNVPIFAQTTSLQPVNMVPASENDPDRVIIYTEQEKLYPERRL